MHLKTVTIAVNKNKLRNCLFVVSFTGSQSSVPTEPQGSLELVLIIYT